MKTINLDFIFSGEHKGALPEEVQILISNKFSIATRFPTSHGEWVIYQEIAHPGRVVAMYSSKSGKHYLLSSKPETPSNLEEVVHNAKVISSSLLEAKLDPGRVLQSVFDHPPGGGTGIWGWTIPVLSSIGGGLAILVANKVFGFSSAGNMFVSTIIGYAAMPSLSISSLFILHYANGYRILRSMSNPEKYLYGKETATTLTTLYGS